MTLYGQWEEGVAKNLSNFQKKLFESFQVANGTNKKKLSDAFPDWFWYDSPTPPSMPRS